MNNCLSLFNFFYQQIYNVYTKELKKYASCCLSIWNRRKNCDQDIFSVSSLITFRSAGKRVCKDTVLSMPFWTGTTKGLSNIWTYSVVVRWRVTPRQPAWSCLSSSTCPTLWRYCTACYHNILKHVLHIEGSIRHVTTIISNMSHTLKVVYDMPPQYCMFLSNMYSYLIEQRFEITSSRYQMHAGALYPQTLQYSHVYI